MTGKIFGSVYSVLKAGIEELPEKIKGQSVTNRLKDKGVTNDELKFADLPIEQDKVYTRDELLALESNRADQFGEVVFKPKTSLDILDFTSGSAGQPQFQTTSLRAGRGNFGYEETVYTFGTSPGRLPKTPTIKQEVTQLVQDTAKKVAADVPLMLDPDERATRMVYAVAKELQTKYPGLSSDAAESLARYPSKPALDKETFESLPEDMLDYVTNTGEARYPDSHFHNVPNYLMHSRAYPDTIANVGPARVLQELQSDLIQRADKNARRLEDLAGVKVPKFDPKEGSEIDKFKPEVYKSLQSLYRSVLNTDDVIGNFAKEAQKLYPEMSIEQGRVFAATLIDHRGMNPAQKIKFPESMVDKAMAPKPSLPESPYENSWLRKGLEREMLKSVDSGINRLAIPIRGDLGNLSRGEGVQVWYETSVFDTAKELARQYGLKFTATPWPASSVTKAFSSAKLQLKNTPEKSIRAFNRIDKAAGLAKGTAKAFTESADNEQIQRLAIAIEQGVDLSKETPESLLKMTRMAEPAKQQSIAPIDSARESEKDMYRLYTGSTPDELEDIGYDVLSIEDDLIAAARRMGYTGSTRSGEERLNAIEWLGTTPTRDTAPLMTYTDEELNALRMYSDNAVLQLDDEDEVMSIISAAAHRTGYDENSDLTPLEYMEQRIAHPTPLDDLLRWSTTSRSSTTELTEDELMNIKAFVEEGGSTINADDSVAALNEMSALAYRLGHDGDPDKVLDFFTNYLGTNALPTTVSAKEMQAVARLSNRQVDELTTAEENEYFDLADRLGYKTELHGNPAEFFRILKSRQLSAEDRALMDKTLSHEPLDDVDHDDILALAKRLGWTREMQNNPPYIDIDQFFAQYVQDIAGVPKQKLASKTALVAEDLTNPIARAVANRKPVDPVQYAVLEVTPESKPLNFKLYTHTTAVIVTAYMALRDGIDPTIELKKEGYDDANIAEVMSYAKGMHQAIDVHKKFTLDQMVETLKKREADVADARETFIEEPGFLEKVEKAFKNQMRESRIWSAQLAIMQGKDSEAELLANLQVIQPNMNSIVTRFSGALGNDEAFAEARLMERRSAIRIQELAAIRGVNLRFAPDLDPSVLDQLAGAGQYYLVIPEEEAKLNPEGIVRAKDGALLRKLDTGVWRSLANEQNEIALGVTGAIGGGTLTARAISPYLKPTTPLTTLAYGSAVFAGSLIGAMGGATLGTELDYLQKSVELSESMSAEIAARKALTAAEASLIGDLIGTSVIKLGARGWNAVIKAKNFISRGNDAGAKDALLEHLFMSEAEADRFIAEMRAVTKDTKVKEKTTEVKDWDNNVVDRETTFTSGMSKDRETLRDLSLTQPGGEAIVAAAARLNPQAGRNAVHAIDKRAKDVLASTEALTDESIGRVLKHDLDNYTADVKKFYGDVKQRLASLPNLNDVKFNYEKLAINPVLEQMEDNIMNPALLERFRVQADKIRGMASGRTMADLVELRQLVNDFKFNKMFKAKQKDYEAIDEVLANIDASLNQGVKHLMPNDGAKWLSDFQLAKTEYAKMYSLKKNVINKALTKKGLKNEAVVDALAKYVDDIDGSFQEVMSKLPIQARKLSEGSVLNSLAKKYSYGADSGEQAIDFPAFSKHLDKIAFTTPEARKTKVAIDYLAEVFRNDPVVAGTQVSLKTPPPNQALTADMVQKAKMYVAGRWWQRLYRHIPTSESNSIAMIYKTADVLKNPLHSKTVKELMEMSEGDVVLGKQIMILQQDAARQLASQDPGMRIKFYDNGKTLSIKGSGPTESIAVHRIATYEIRKQVANKYGIDLADQKKLDSYLLREGYIATQQGSDSVRKLK